jgi:hypothetical protein
LHYCHNAPSGIEVETTSNQYNKTGIVSESNKYVSYRIKKQCWQRCGASAGNSVVPMLAMIWCKRLQRCGANAGNDVVPMLATVWCQCWQRCGANAGNDV